ncbi:tripartite tricarboxylate transporter permease [Azospirillum brasilense]|uniref:C4-dicarboxylate ABC transporter permease n=1 Tax=Azospirillum brasilense TaxID=192 RepID=A0A6L3AYR0_AZOBR|nr:tripartite tricarboxylate transporter permease [Azospirillum brasilense]KAA0684837.1 C4-dicarboxylate ABC transporter permease [Azospirillum brasilense]
MVILTDVLGVLLDVHLLLVIVASAIYGLVLGAIPGLTALMATALLVPVVMFMEPVPAIAAIITSSAMAIFAGDIPGALMRMPGTPASAAYTDDAYSLTREGKAGLSLGAGLFSSVLGGLLSALVLTLAAPNLAELALQFSSVEYFWLAVLGLSCATFVGGSSLLKGVAALLFGLGLSTIGMDPVSGTPRFTFGVTNLLGGLGLIPLLIGVFAISELLRTVTLPPTGERQAQLAVGSVSAGMGRLMWRHRREVLRGSTLGTLVGALPGAGADIAAWISYAVTRRSQKGKDPNALDQKVERLISAGAANNASLGGAYIPATVFGIPGDAITAIVISVMFLKGLNPGPTIFLNNPTAIYSIFAIFFVANLLMIPLGILCIRTFGLILKVPRSYLTPIILLFCIVGAFSVENTLFAVGIIAIVGLLGYFMEANDIPMAPAVLGLILGPVIEQTFMTSMLKSGGELSVFFDRPLAIALAVVTLGSWALTGVLKLVDAAKARPVLT